MTDTKICSNTGCDDPQPLTNFYRKGRNKDGYEGQCKTCRNKASETYRLTHHKPKRKATGKIEMYVW